jgi:hypothetical protein
MSADSSEARKTAVSDDVVGPQPPPKGLAPDDG